MHTIARFRTTQQGRLFWAARDTRSIPHIFYFTTERIQLTQPLYYKIYTWRLCNRS